MIQNILSNDIWLMEATYLKYFMETAASKDIAEALNAAAGNEKLFFSFFDDEQEKDDKPYKVQNEMAIINIEGPLMKKAKGFFAMLLGIQSTEKIGENFNMALDDKDVSGIFLNINSPGGDADGTEALSDIIFDGRGQKPIMSFVDSNMLSAAYWIGSASDHMVVSDSLARIGSIGAVAVHREISKAAAEAGIKFTVFASGDFKKIGNEFEPLSGKDVKHLQGKIEFVHARFLDGVTKNLGVPISKMNKDARESEIFLGQQGIDAGLAHEILTKDQAFEKLRSVIDGNDKFGESKLKMKGGVKTMDEKEKVRLELKIEGLEADLVAKVGEIKTLNSQNEAQASNITETATTMTDLQATNTELTEKVTGLETKLKDAKPFVEIGEKAIKEIRLEITKLSVQARGKDHNKDLVDKQLAAFGNDYEALLMFKAGEEATIAKLFKKGEINPEGHETDADKDAADYKLGKAIGSGTSLKVVK